MPINALASPASWALHTFPSVRNSGSAALINSVSCSSNVSCAAGGFTTDSNGDVQALVSTFDGHNWTDQQVATSLNGGGHAQVSAISCTSNSFCVADGFFSRPNNTTGAFVSLYNGQTWNDLEVGNTLGGIGASQLTTVSCASNTLCVAGGFYVDNSFNSQAFVSTYNGQTWTDHEIASSLNPGGDAQVSAISCPTVTFCLAGGFSAVSNSQYRAFVSFFNGQTWSDQFVGSSLNGGTNAEVDSISCTGAAFCVVGGQYSATQSKYPAFVSVYNGHSWTDLEVAGALTVGNYAIVNSVSCTSSTSCVAGGYFQDINNRSQAFVSAFNGQTWTDQEVVSALNLGNNATVSSVSCSSTTVCVAAGQYSDGSGKSPAFVSIYNGHDWTDQELPDLLQLGDAATANTVSCTTKSLCMVGGQYSEGVGLTQAYVTSATLSSPTRASGTVYFDSGSSTLSTKTKQVLNGIVTKIVNRQQLSVTLNGYTDPSGTKQSNLRLARMRVDAVKSYLQAKLHLLGDESVTFLLHPRGVFKSVFPYAKDRKVTIS
jgi:outer membrane protein OmpA-like peptidoglycan-associated protein